ncbi:MAG TPA: hypothetical protein VIQ05_18995 [Tardiphaga sp.]
MAAQRVEVSDVTDAESARTYIDQTVLATFCRVLAQSRLQPVEVMQMLASALGATYREVVDAHRDGQCPCGWRPLPALDIEALHASLADAAAPRRPDDLHAMVAVGRA